jgi:5'-3' exonuclease
MGIPRYLSYIMQRHPEILELLSKIRPGSRKRVDFLYIDCNSLIYDAVRDGADDDDTIYKAVAMKIREYTELIGPRKGLGVMFDGVAPVAKMEQQRTRRYKGAFEKELEGKIVSGWDTTAITPGTAFMNGIGSRLRQLLSDVDVPLLVSGPDEPGEGEHKIFERIRNRSSDHANATTVVYGLDADLIMLTLNHLNVAPRLYLFRETPLFARSLNRDLVPNASYLLDIPALARSIAEEFRHSAPGAKRPDHAFVSDYILLCFFLGNDFLPHFPSINIRSDGIQMLLDAYKFITAKGAGPLVEGGRVKWKNLRALVTRLAELERDSIIAQVIQREKMGRRAHQLPIHDGSGPALNVPLMDRRTEVYIDPERDGWERRYYSSLLGSGDDESRKAVICQNYIEGLEWTYKYYTTGCVDWDWHYQYNYPPLLSDLAKNTPYFDVDVMASTPAGPVDPRVQLAYVLPWRSLGLMSNNDVQKLRRAFPEYYTPQHDFEWSFCRYFWEAHVLFPPLTIDKIRSVLSC